MKKILNALFLTLVLLLSVVIFFPKDKLYYLLQEKLLSYNIQVESKSVESKAFCLDVKDTYILLSGARVAKVDEVHISLFGTTLKGVKSLSSFKNMLPSAKDIKINYTLGTFGEASGDFGKISSTLKLNDKKVIFEATINEAVRKKYKMIFREFKKVGDKYVYQFNF